MATVQVGKEYPNIITNGNFSLNQLKTPAGVVETRLRRSETNNLHNTDYLIKT